jgi:selenophosphate synthetase-related protein
VWEKFTALPILLVLQGIEGVKLLHDVSEGGVKGALLEVLGSLRLSLSFSSVDVTYADFTNELNQDLLRAPSYGTIIAVADPKSVGEIVRVCTERGVQVSQLGPLRNGTGLIVNGEIVIEQAWIGIDELYGSFRKNDAHKNPK